MYKPKTDWTSQFRVDLSTNVTQNGAKFVESSCETSAPAKIDCWLVKD